MNRFGDPTRWLLGGVLCAIAILYFILPRPPEPAPNPVTGEPKTIIHIIGGAMERDRQMWKALEEGFEADNPDIDLRILTGGGTQRKVDTMIAGGVAPDLIEMLSDAAYQYIDSGVLLDLTPMIQQDAQLVRDIEGWTDANGVYHEPDYFEFTFEPYRRGKELYALPEWYVNFFMYYNKTLFDKYNVPYPDEDWDWQGLRDRAIALTRDRQGRQVRIPLRDADGRIVRDERGWTVYVDNPEADHVPYDYGFQFAQWQHGPENFIRENGGSFFADVGKPTEHVSVSGAAYDALWFLYEMSVVNRTQPNRFVATKATQDLAFKGGHLAMMGPYGVFVLLDARDTYSTFDWDVAPLPKGPTGIRAAMAQPSGLGIPKQCKHPEAAFRFAKWYSGPRGGAILSKWPVFVPPRRSLALSEEHFLDPATKPDSDWAMVHDVTYPWVDPRTGKQRIGYSFIPAAASVRYWDVYEAINKGLGELFVYGSYTLKTFREFRQEHHRDPNEMEALALHKEALKDAAKDIEADAERAYRWAEAQSGTANSGGMRGIWAMLLPVLVALVTVVAFTVWRAARDRSQIGPLEKAQERWGWLLISPWLVGFTLLTAGPILFSIGLSFTKWQALGDLSQAQFVGVENYARALRGDDPQFYKSLRATLQYTMLAVPLQVVGGLALALLMNQKMRGINFWRTLYFVPSILPIVAVTVLYLYLFDSNRGWVNHVLRLLGVANPPAWLSSPDPVLGVPAPMLMFICMSLWAIGGTMIIYLGSLQGIPTQLYEAAEVDGAGRIRQLVHVTLPMITPVLFFMLIMGIIGSFQVFTNAYVMFDSGGGPGDSTLFYVLHLFNEAVNRYRFGYGAALAWILFGMILLLTVLIFKSSPMWVYYEGQREKAKAKDTAKALAAADGRAR